MTKRMLIDATHPEETRVAVVDGTRLEEFDFEIASRRQIKSNIYLAKVTRVEPSLQAAFVEYGGNRHGFLPFPEIHPDYYRIPVGDRPLYAEPEDDEPPRHARGKRHRPRPSSHEDAAHDDFAHEDMGQEHAADEHRHEDEHFHETADAEPEADPDDAGAVETETVAAEPEPAASEYEAADKPAEHPGPVARDSPEEDDPADDRAPGTIAAAAASDPIVFDDVPVASESSDAEAEHPSDDGAAPADDQTEPPAEPVAHAGTAEDAGSEEEATVDTIGGDEVEDAQRRRRFQMPRYKIQEVIKRRQIMLVQVSKEERGNKGAAVTTFLSLPGRYCVLMPNTSRGGGVSRKIANPADRKRMKELISDLEVPEGMSVILRTAGVERSKAEIKRDLEYLLRLWESIRTLTLQSTAPALIYEEGNLVKRAIRDLYTRDIDSIEIAGEEGYRQAKDFMRMLMPSHAKRVQPYRDPSIPLFFRYQVESQIDLIHNPVGHLKSGGYIVINQTEALVSIDVNSGRSTRERNIEETAVKTNCEAADEIARQLRLRDLGGLIVIDFIDMDEPRHDAQVERRLKEAMKNDRARIQVGRISPFGLLELSRQRLHPSLLETNFHTCSHCLGTGLVRSIESAALLVLRAVEEEGIKRRSAELAVTVAGDIALYILNQKRAKLIDIEQRYGFSVRILADDSLIAPEHRIERLKLKPPGSELPPTLSQSEVMAVEIEREEEPEEEEGDTEEAQEAKPGEPAAKGGEEGEGDRKRRRRRNRRRRGRDEGQPEGSGDSSAMTDEAGDDEQGEPGEDDGAEPAPEAEPQLAEAGSEPEQVSPEGGEPQGEEPQGEEAGARRRRGRRGGRGRSRRTEAENGETVVAEAGFDRVEPADAAPEAAHPPPQEPVEAAAAAESEPQAEPEPRPEPAEVAPAESVAKAAPAEAEPSEAEPSDAQPPEAGPSDAGEPTQRPVARAYEIVNQPPPEPKRGFWKRLVR